VVRLRLLRRAGRLRGRCEREGEEAGDSMHGDAYTYGPSDHVSAHRSCAAPRRPPDARYHGRMSSPGKLGAAIGAALLFGCAHRKPPPLRAARLEIDTSHGGFRPFVRARIAGQSMRLLVDTGTFKSVLPESFARAQHLRTGSTGLQRWMLDGNGRLTVAPTLPDVPVQFDGEAAGGTMEFLMNPSGMPGALLSPQELLPAGSAMVIDLPREELRYEPEEAALKRLGEGGVALTNVVFHGCVQEGFFNRPRRFVRVTIQGIPSDMLVDTGAETTVLARNHPALAAMMAVKGDRGRVVGVTSVGHGLLVDDVAVGFADGTFPVTVMVVPASDPCADGVLGTDVLRHCTMVWGHSSLWVACHAPPRPVEQAPPASQ
jgi:hypothetical protein